MSNLDSSSDPASSEPQSFLDRLRALLGTFRPQGSLRTDLEEILDEQDTAEEVSEFTPSERKMLRNILHLKEVGIGDIMVPRAEIVAVQKDATLGELMVAFANASHSRLVVHDDGLDDPVGMVHIRDLLTFIASGGRPRDEVEAEGLEPGALNLGAFDLGQSLADTGLIRRILYVPPSMPAIDLLVSMQAARVHLALVIDEYGGTDGLVSMEDVVEEIVGEIEDEHDEEESDVQRQADGSFLADARTPVDDVIEVLGPDFAPAELVDEVDSLGGLVVTLAARVPKVGETVLTPGGFTVEVLEADPRRVKRLRIVPPSPPERDGPDEAGEAA
ncbi:HlyC/CorC family transporter [Aquabacter sp. L1I39]|uniref:hemolysin family protein n=1 Tax=Aquabacter sp. L1I39 TaxID=2820278 RepID=UPI001AD9666B|nr:hemolysin family protein [Aquabacter sp. L1I39]QTL05163.1 HlyC/CorC family transporter [Aquabacter sp. L1I39]